MTTMEQTLEDFSLWWNNEGSGIRPGEQEDCEEFAKDIALYAWREAVNQTTKEYELKEYKEHMEQQNREQ